MKWIGKKLCSSLFDFPRAAILLTVLSFNMLGKGLQGLMDPKQNKEPGRYRLVARPKEKSDFTIMRA